MMDRVILAVTTVAAGIASMTDIRSKLRSGGSSPNNPTWIDLPKFVCALLRSDPRVGRSHGAIMLETDDDVLIRPDRNDPA